MLVVVLMNNSGCAKWKPFKTSAVGTSVCLQYQRFESGMLCSHCPWCWLWTSADLAASQRSVIVVLIGWLQFNMNNSLIDCTRFSNNTASAMRLLQPLILVSWAQDAISILLPSSSHTSACLFIILTALTITVLVLVQTLVISRLQHCNSLLVVVPACNVWPPQPSWSNTDHKPSTTHCCWQSAPHCKGLSC